MGVTVQFSARNDLSIMILLTWSINDNCNVQTSDVLQYVCAVGLRKYRKRRVLKYSIQMKTTTSKCLQKSKDERKSNCCMGMKLYGQLRVMTELELSLTDWGAPFEFRPTGDHIFPPVFSQSNCSSLKL